jgi:hypothetical protein
MSQCEDIRRELEAFLGDDVDETKRNEIRLHLDECQECSEVLRQLEKLAGVLQTWREIEPSPMMFEKLKARLKKPEPAWNRIFTYSNGKRVALRFAQVATIVILTLLISNLLQKPAPKVSENLAPLNFYLNEHQGAVVQSISAELQSRPATRMYVGRDNIIYFEFMDDHPKLSRPGIIFKGPIVRNKIQLPKAPAITKGRLLELSQIKNAVDFDPVMPPRLPHDYILESVRKIEDYHCLHLLYVKGMETISLFEQPSDRQDGLVTQDFREYAVYSRSETDAESEKQSKGTILSWSNGTLSFVLIGGLDMARLMDIVQSLSSTESQGRGHRK